MVAQSCKAVIACRARKDQKAKLTRLVREGNREVVTLGIGDGANDVEMIRAAHIGVGIIGKEGTQAVNNADYAISQFRYLTRLILVYGHHDYRGITLAALLPLLWVFRKKRPEKSGVKGAATPSPGEAVSGKTDKTTIYRTKPE